MAGRAQRHKPLVNQRFEDHRTEYLNQPFEDRQSRFVPTARGSTMSINSARRISAAFLAAVDCFDVLHLEPKTTTPSSAPIIVAGPESIAPLLTVIEPSDANNGIGLVFAQANEQ